MDAQTRHGIWMLVTALALALVRAPRGRRLLTLLKGILIGAFIGALLSLAPQVFLILTHPGPINQIQQLVLRVAVACGVFYGITIGANVVSIVFAAFEVRWWWRWCREHLSPDPDAPPGPAPPAPHA